MHMGDHGTQRYLATCEPGTRHGPSKPCIQSISRAHAITVQLIITVANRVLWTSTVRVAPIRPSASERQW